MINPRGRSAGVPYWEPTMQPTSDARFWSDLASSYDGHVASREAAALVPRIADLLARRSCVLDLGCGTGDVALASVRFRMPLVFVAATMS